MSKLFMLQTFHVRTTLNQCIGVKEMIEMFIHSN